MANVLKDEKKQQIIALGRLGWSLRKIQQATRVRRETISAYLRGAGMEIWPPGRWRRESKAKPAIEVITMYGGKWVPNKSHTVGSGNEFHVGPHIMIIGLDQKMMQILNQDGSNGEPYVNHLPGPHSELFLVIPIREWDDAQAVPRMGAETR